VQGATWARPPVPLDTALRPGTALVAVQVLDGQVSASSPRVMSAGHAFIQKLRRGHLRYETLAPERVGSVSRTKLHGVRGKHLGLAHRPQASGARKSGGTCADACVEYPHPRPALRTWRIPYSFIWPFFPIQSASESTAMEWRERIRRYLRRASPVLAPNGTDRVRCHVGSRTSLLRRRRAERAVDLRSVLALVVPAPRAASFSRTGWSRFRLRPRRAT
jgi:hypothetical protein